MNGYHPYCSKRYQHIVFEHFKAFYGEACLLGAARDQVTGTVYFFLLLRKMNKVFFRQKRGDTWEEILDQNDYGWVRKIMESALVHKKMHAIRTAIQKVSFLKPTK